MLSGDESDELLIFFSLECALWLCEMHLVVGFRNWGRPCHYDVQKPMIVHSAIDGLGNTKVEGLGVSPNVELRWQFRKTTYECNSQNRNVDGRKFRKLKIISREVGQRVDAPTIVMFLNEIEKWCRKEVREYWTYAVVLCVNWNDYSKLRVLVLAIWYKNGKMAVL